MFERDTEITYHPIGTVSSPFETPEEVPKNPDSTVDAEGVVTIDAKYAEGLTELEGFSHIVLLTHLDRVADYTLRCDPPFADGVCPGIFATRGPRRPNPIGLTIVRLRRIEDDRLHVSNLDLADQTPVLDVKPFAPKPDEITDIKGGWLDDYGSDEPL